MLDYVISNRLGGNTAQRKKLSDSIDKIESTFNQEAFTGRYKKPAFGTVRRAAASGRHILPQRYALRAKKSNISTLWSTLR